jgi:hypothetical protein
MSHVLFRCPYTGFNVQHRLDDDAPSRDQAPSYETVSCPACNMRYQVLLQLLADEEAKPLEE